jgi:hypothetical protein
MEINMLEIIQTWPKEGQGLFFIFCLCLLSFVICFCVYWAFYFIAVLMRGYPAEITDTSFERDECLHCENMTNYCIKSGRNCITEQECAAEIDKINKNAKTPLPICEEPPC